MAWRALQRVGPVLVPRCPRLSPPPLRVPAARRLATSSLVLSGEWRRGGRRAVAGGRAARFCQESPLPRRRGCRRGRVGSCSRAALQVLRVGADLAARPGPACGGAVLAGSAGCPRRPARRGPRGLKRPPRSVRGAAPKFKPPPGSPCCAEVLGAVAILAARAVGRARRGAAGCCGFPGAARLISGRRCGGVPVGSGEKPRKMAEALQGLGVAGGG